MEALSTAETSLEAIKQATNPSKAEAGKQSLANDFDEFLLLLTTQLENQDPTEPLDTNDFTNQLVQFSIAEQAVNTNANLEELIGFKQEEKFSTAVSYIGRSVDAKGNAGEIIEGVGSFIYSLATPANTANIVITDGAGRAVFSGQGPTAEGKNRVIWDGVNSFNGVQEPDGTYFINVTATNASGNPVDVTTFTTGVVNGAEVQGEEMVLSVAGTNVKIEDIDAVRQATQLVAVNEPEPEPEGPGGIEGLLEDLF